MGISVSIDLLASFTESTDLMLTDIVTYGFFGVGSGNIIFI